MLLLLYYKLIPSSHMEVGCPGTWGTGTADPKPKQPEHPRALLATQPRALPARKTLRQSPPHWMGRTVENLLSKTIRLYKKYNNKGGGWGGEPWKASYMNTPCTLRISKTTCTCNGACTAPMRLPLTQWSPTALEVMPERHNTNSLQADHAKRSQMPRLRQAMRILAPCH